MSSTRTAMACSGIYNHQGQDGDGNDPPAVDTTAGVYAANTVVIGTGGSATKIVCWKADGKTLGYATMAAGDITACN